MSYFTQYQGGYNWVPKDYYSMLTQPTKNITEGATKMVSNIAGGYTDRAMYNAAEAKDATAKMQQAEGARMAAQPAFEMAQANAQRTGVPMPESLAAAGPNIGRMSHEQLQGFMGGLGNYNQMAAQQQAAAQAAQRMAQQQRDYEMMNSFMSRSMGMSPFSPYR